MISDGIPKRPREINHISILTSLLASAILFCCNISKAEDLTLRYMYDHVLCVAESIRQIDDNKADPEVIAIGVNALCKKEWDTVVWAIRTNQNVRIRDGLASVITGHDAQIMSTILETRAHRKNLN